MLHMLLQQHPQHLIYRICQLLLSTFDFWVWFRTECPKVYNAEKIGKTTIDHPFGNGLYHLFLVFVLPTLVHFPVMTGGSKARWRCYRRVIAFYLYSISIISPFVKQLSVKFLKKIGALKWCFDGDIKRPCQIPTG